MVGVGVEAMIKNSTYMPVNESTLFVHDGAYCAARIRTKCEDTNKEAACAGAGDAGGVCAAAVGGRPEPGPPAQAWGSRPASVAAAAAGAGRSTLEAFHAACAHIFASSTGASQA